MKLNLLTYSDSLYKESQMKLVQHAYSLGCFNEIYTKNRDHLIATDFYHDHKYILDKPKGGGLCLWKPYFIIDTLCRMDEGDVLLYMDSADWINNGEQLRDSLLNFMQDKDMLLTAGAFPNKNYTKRDAFVLMDCDNSKYWDAIQLEAGVLVVKNTEFAAKIMLEWLTWCENAAIITDDENVCELPNLDGFIDIRYDQSVLTNVAIKNCIAPTDFIRKFVTCNVNMPCN